MNCLLPTRPRSILLDLSGPVPVIVDQDGKRHEMHPDPGARIRTVWGQHDHKGDCRGAFRAHVIAEDMARREKLPLEIRGLPEVRVAAAIRKADYRARKKAEREALERDEWSDGEDD